MKPGSYQVKTNNFVFYLELVSYDEYHTFNFGDPFSPEGPCCTLTYDANRPERLKLDSVVYDARCSDGMNLQRGEGTIEMLRSILSLCVHVFPAIKRVYFNDVSSFECNGHNVLLSYTGLLIHGDTWYGRHFGAQPASKRLREKIKDFLVFLNEPPSRGVFTFFGGESDWPSWHEFFLHARNQHGCEFFITNKLEIKAKAKMDLLYSEWYITSTTVKTYDVTHEIRKVRRRSMPGGGGWRGVPMMTQRLTYEDSFV